ncbi:uncharacterized protein [Hyperolius riggenbachi]|uniref:uncharacterized protein n=1 Tax=Hyperolius riggenbachi TaxID=752182 RepID=UPI0035A3A197
MFPPHKQRHPHRQRQVTENTNMYVPKMIQLLVRSSSMDHAYPTYSQAQETSASEKEQVEIPPPLNFPPIEVCVEQNPTLESPSTSSNVFQNFPKEVFYVDSPTTTPSSSASIPKGNYYRDDNYVPNESELTADHIVSSGSQNTVVEAPQLSQAESVVHDRKFIVFESCLDTLLSKLHCPIEDCFEAIRKIEKKTRGTMLTVYTTCSGGHRQKLWQSQPIVKKFAAGNLVITSALVSSGSSFTKVAEMMDFAGITFLSANSFYKYQRRYIFPAIDHSWQLEKSRVKDLLSQKPLFLCGDGQCDSPGYSAKFCTYTFLDAASKLVLDFEVVQVSQTTSSSAMEKEGFKTCLDRIGQSFEVQVVGTDRHVGIRHLMSVEYTEIDHQFDMWHFLKPFKKQLIDAASKSKNKEQRPWIGMIVNHFYWSSRTSRGDANVFRDKLLSLLHHIVGEHEWKDGETLHRCEHGPLEVEGRVNKWLTTKMPAFEALSKLITSPKLDKDIPHLTLFSQTGILETFHSMVLKYRSKRIHYSMDSMEARTKLAVLAHNRNAGRLQAVVKYPKLTSQPQGTTRTRLEFPRSQKKWVVRKVFEKMDFGHVYPILTDTIRIVTGDLQSTWVSRKSSLPPNIARLEKPEKEVAVAAQLTRFPTRQ